MCWDQFIDVLVHLKRRTAKGEREAGGEGEGGQEGEGQREGKEIESDKEVHRPKWFGIAFGNCGPFRACCWPSIKFRL